MNGWKFKGGIIAVLVLVLLNVQPVFSQTGTEMEIGRHEAAIDEELQWLQEEAAVTFVVTASRVMENIKKSAASISVITEKEIRQMGARHLMDVLKRVPGMSDRFFGDGLYKVESRGISKVGGQDILIMINTHPVNSNFTGGATPAYDLLSLDNVKRIEVIRGPGSALYGANAFAGVVNIFTKDGEDVDGGMASVSAGSYDTRQVNLLAGDKFNDLEVALNVNYYDTDGFEPYIVADTLTVIDEKLGTNSSLTPTDAKTEEEKYEVSFTMEYKGLTLDSHYIDREKTPFITPTYSVTEDNENEIEDYFVNLSYERDLFEDFNFMIKGYFNRNDYRNYVQGPKNQPIITPEGVQLLENGYIVELENTNDRMGGELQLTWRGLKSHTFVFGATYEEMEQRDVGYSANFLYTPVEGVVVPLPGVQDLNDIQNYSKEADREFLAFFAQDLWDITDNLRLTIGARYDDYSDFGGSFNPRVGLAWEFIKGYDLKLVYGRAFRAPTFQELYTQNNPSVIGNPDLDPETVDTYEVSFGAQLDPRLNIRVTGFKNVIKDNIDLVFYENVGRVFENKSELSSHGFEAEMRYDFGKGSYLGMNYTWQHAENEDTGERLFNVPGYKGNFMANFRINEYLNLYSDYHFEGGFVRESGDPREELDYFGIASVTLIAKNFLKFLPGLELRGSVYNLFDERYKTPVSKGSLPGDQPMPETNFLVEMRYTF